MCRSGSRAAATSKMEGFVIIVNGCKPLTIITKRFILDVAAVLDPPLMCNGNVTTRNLELAFSWNFSKILGNINLLIISTFFNMSLLSLFKFFWKVFNVTTFTHVFRNLLMKSYVMIFKDVCQLVFNELSYLFHFLLALWKKRAVNTTKILTQLFSCEICEIFKNTYFEEHLRTTASEPFLLVKLILRTILKLNPIRTGSRQIDARQFKVDTILEQFNAVVP